MIALDKMGKRICIIGSSNSGKSTLAEALSMKLNILAHHLDQYAHVENTDWQRQSDEVFIKKHHDIIAEDSWIIDGNYSICMKDRLDLATFVIWLDPNVFSSIFRYIWRSLKNDLNRPGRLKGTKKEFNFWLVKWIAINYPKNRKKYQRLINKYPDLPILHIHSMKQLKKYYEFWNI